MQQNLLLSGIHSATVLWMLFNELVRKKVTQEVRAVHSEVDYVPIVPQLSVIVFYFKVNFVSEPSQ